MRKLLLTFGVTLLATACAGGGSSSQPVGGSTPAAPVAATGESGPAASPPGDAAAPAESATAAARAESAPATPVEADAAAEGKEPAFREITIPAGTALPLTMETTVASDASDVEDQVRATLRKPITIDGTQALPQGTTFIGHVTEAERSAKVKGRARVAFRFTRADLPGEGGQVNVRTGTVSRVAEATKKRDAATIGGGAVGGAIVGGILGGGDGAAKGAVIGGAGGTGVVLATRGKEVRVPAGTPISVKLTAPVTVRVPLR